MKKFFKIIAYNLLFFILFFIFADYITYKIQVKRDYSGWIVYTRFLEAYKFMPIKNFKETYAKNVENKEDSGWFRPDEITNSKKNEIVLLGCSFTYGTKLQENETFSYKLSKHTKRTVFNRGIPGSCINQMLYMIQAGLSSNIKNPEYFIYTFLDCHLLRLYMPASFFHNVLMYYKNDNGELKSKTDSEIWYWHSYLLRAIYEQLIYNGYFHKNKEQRQMMLQHLITTNNEIKKKYPASKFVVFTYSGDEEIKSIEQELKNEGILVIYLSELSNIDFTKIPYVLYDGHPSEKAWDVIVPFLSKKLSL